MKELFIALIEDDEDDVSLLTECFRKQGAFALKSFGTASDFLNYPLNGSLPCLIVVDLNLPDIRGLDFVQHIRLTSIYINIPVIIYTTHCSKHEAQACEDLNIPLFKKPDNLQEWNKTAALMLQCCNTSL